VVSVREHDEREGAKNRVRDAVHLLRSYEHIYHDAYESELPDLGRDSSTLIYEAARATSAAPFFFKAMEIRRYKYMDGGVGYNNPSLLAWNEVVQMTSDRSINPSLFLSVGTGRSRPQSRFGGLPSLIKWARKSITETESNHVAMVAVTNAARTRYYRMTVHSGLEKMSLGEWKKKRRTKTEKNQARTENGAARQVATGRENEPPGAAAGNPPDQPSAGRRLKEEKWDYVTLNEIRRCTNNYCNPRQDSHLERTLGRQPRIDQCAEQLLDISRRRMAANPDRWRNFITNPYETLQSANPTHS
jgi:hypothetical protein